jgi:glycosyltransferase involved in cell wall biosynthesis
MTNDEILMPNQLCSRIQRGRARLRRAVTRSNQGSTESHPTVVIHSSFVLRHWTFFIGGFSGLLLILIPSLSLPEISVLMPTYNYASYLPEAIASVLAQDFQDFELLIVDDCSSDDTAGAVKPFCDRDTRVRFAVNPSNLGMVNNWKKCLDQARGRHIKFLFGDDKLSDPRALGKLLALLRDNPSATLAASARTILDEKSNVIEIVRPLRDGCHNGRKIIAECLNENANLIGEPSAVMFRKKDAEKNFDPKHRQIVDLEMWFHLLENGDLACTREPLCAFRRHARQQSALNDASGLTRQEHALFFVNYAMKEWLPAKSKFSALYALRRLRRKTPGPISPELSEAGDRLSAQLGRGNYLFHWMFYKLTIPLKNLNRSMEKKSNF